LHDAHRAKLAVLDDMPVNCVAHLSKQIVRISFCDGVIYNEGVVALNFIELIRHEGGLSLVYPL
jgi:hypothetical protein